MTIDIIEKISHGDSVALEEVQLYGHSDLTSSFDIGHVRVNGDIGHKQNICKT